jgi:hypothetical protein
MDAGSSELSTHHDRWNARCSRVDRGIGAHITVLAALLAGLFLAQVASAAGQQNPPASGQNSEAVSLPRVAVGEINGNPGSSLMVPLYFTPDPNRPLRSITVEIDYVSNSLKFQSAASGTAVEQVGARLNATLTDGAPNEQNVIRSKLRVEISVPETQAAKGIPEGLLSFLMFRVNTDARPFAIRLNTSVVSAETAQTPPQTVADVSTIPGLVVVDQGDMLPEATCFFFTH